MLCIVFVLITAKQKPNDQGMNWNEYQNLDVIYAWMEGLEYNYPSLCSVVPIGITTEGRTMKVSILLIYSLHCLLTAYIA